jgi:uncharacterized RDD family membrane protein YckC
MKYATFWQRFAAAWIDFFVLLPFTLIQSWLGSASKTAALVLVLPMTSAYLGYTIYCHGRFGQTVGKYATGIRVLRTTGERLAGEKLGCAVQSTLRFPFSVSVHRSSRWLPLQTPSITTLAGCSALRIFRRLSRLGLAWTSTASQIWVWSELVTMLFNKRRRALHDFIAGTVVKAKQRTTDAETAGCRTHSSLLAGTIANAACILDSVLGFSGARFSCWDIFDGAPRVRFRAILVNRRMDVSFGALMFKRARRFKYLSAFCFVSLGGCSSGLHGRG